MNYLSACSARGGDLNTFFSHENHAWPPNLAELNKMRPPSNKADLVTCLEKLENLSLMLKCEIKQNSLM